MTGSGSGGVGERVLVLPDDPGAWAAIGYRPEHEDVQRYRTIRTFLARWHRWTADWYPIRETPEFTEVTLPSGVCVRAYGRILADDGEDITDSYLDDGHDSGDP